jgi:hypothetical protein
MASSSAIRAGQAFVELFVKQDLLIKGLRAAEQAVRAFGQRLSSIGKGMAAIGGGLAMPMLGAAKMFASAGRELRDMSARTGMSVEALSELRYAAQMTGTDVESLETDLRRMQKTIGAAAGGSDEAQQALASLGTTVAELKALSPDQQFMLLASRLAEIRNPAQRTAAAIAVFGKSGTNLLPMLEGGIQRLEQLRQEARDLGLVMSTEAAEDATRLAVKLDTLWMEVKRGTSAVGSALTPILLQAGQAMIDAVKSCGDWIKGHRELVSVAFQAAAATLALGTVMATVGSILTRVAPVFGVMANGLRSIQRLAGGIAGGIGRIFAGLGSAATSGIVAVFAGIGSGIRHVVTVAGSGAMAMLRFVQSLNLLDNAAAAVRIGLAGAAATYRAMEAAVAVLDVGVRGLGRGVLAMGQGLWAGLRGIYAIQQIGPGLRAAANAGSLLGTALRQAVLGPIALVQHFSAVMRQASAMARTAWTTTCSLVSAAWSAAAAAASTVWTFFTVTVPAFCTAAWTATCALVSAAWAGAAAMAATAWSVLTSLPSILSAAWVAIPGVIAAAWTAAATVVSAAWTAIPAVVSAAWSAMAAALPAILTAALIAGGVLVLAYFGGEFAKSLRDAVVGAATNAWGAIKTTASTAIGGVRSAATSVAGAIATGMSDAWQSALGSAANFVNATKTLMASLWADIQAGFENIMKDGAGAWNAIVSAISAGQYQAAFQVVVAFAKLELTRLKNWFVDLWASLWPSIAAGASTAFDRVLTSFRSAWIQLKLEIKTLLADVQRDFKIAMVETNPLLSSANVQATTSAETGKAAASRKLAQTEAAHELRALSSKNHGTAAPSPETSPIDPAVAAAQEEELAGLQKNLAAATAAAKKAAGENPTPTEPIVPRGRPEDFEDMAVTQQAAKETPGKEKTQGVAGSFSAATAWGLGGVAAIDTQTLATMQKVAEATAKIVDPIVSMAAAITNFKFLGDLAGGHGNQVVNGFFGGAMQWARDAAELAQTPTMRQVALQARGVQPAIDRTATRITSAGVNGKSGPKDFAERTAIATELTAANTTKLLRLAANGLNFG